MFSSLGKLFATGSAKGVTLSVLAHTVGLGLAGLVFFTDLRLDSVALDPGQPMVLLVEAELTEDEPLETSAEFSFEAADVEVMPHRVRVADQTFDLVPTTPSVDVVVKDLPPTVVSAPSVDAALALSHQSGNLNYSKTQTTATSIPEQTASPAKNPSPSKTAIKSRPASFGHCPSPSYPSLAKQNGWEGTVVVEMTVSARGHVTQITVLKSSGHPVLDAEVVNTVRHWVAIPSTEEDPPMQWQGMTIRRGERSVESVEIQAFNFHF